MAGLDSMRALQEFIKYYNLFDVDRISAKIAVIKNGKLIHNNILTIYIQRNSYGGWVLGVEDIKPIIKYESFNTDFQDMYFENGILTVYSDGCEISISV